jgi:tRNA(adenine34) deaminase
MNTGQQTFSNRDQHFMQLAIEQARLGLSTPGGAHVGCVITRNGELVASGFNEVEGSFDPSAHSEIVTMRRLCKQWQVTNLAGCTLYCTLQPCGMCTVACIWAGISRIVYGATRNDVNSIYFAESHANTADYLRDAFRSDIELTSGVLAEECSAFYVKKREATPPGADPAHAPTTAAT